jgi:hypothetical protein
MCELGSKVESALRTRPASGVSALTRGPNRPKQFSNPGEDLPDDFAIYRP